MPTTADRHDSDAMAGPHGAGDHGGDHGHDDHAHADEDALGPVDTATWGAGALGIAAGLAVAALMAMSAGWFG
jgi:hypothetical protein